MTATILDGRATLAAIKAELRDAGGGPGATGASSPGSAPSWSATTRPAAGTSPPSTGTAPSSGSPASSANCRPATTQAEVEAVVDELNADPACTAFLVQQPTGLDEFAILSRVDPAKDVDGLHPCEPRRAGARQARHRCPAPRSGIVELLRRYDVPINGAHAVVVGRGLTVGRPMGLLLTRRSENATVTLCHTGTRNLPAHGLAGGHRDRGGRRARG